MALSNTDTLLNYRVSASEKLVWDGFLKAAEKQIAVEGIVRQWLEAKKHFELYSRSLPEPIWKKRKYEHQGANAWQEIQKIATNNHTRETFAIYLHIPFCDKTCGFCDCYSISNEKNNSKLTEAYTTCLIHEMNLWKNVSNISARPISTIHFGGGTPNSIEQSLFHKIVSTCHTSFNLSPQTELALESISSLLTEEHLKELKGLGFSRLHVGVQTLESNIRRNIGRRELKETVLEKLELALNLGFIVSVDLILGLPGQSMEEFLSSLQILVELGIHGFSFYQLQVSSHNKRFISKIKSPDQSTLLDYLLFQLGEAYLISEGYKKNHFDHFSHPEDHNLYGTHMSRNENLLALGTSADGVINSYHYRHPKLKEYLSNPNFNEPPLEGGLWETTFEIKARPILSGLMHGKLTHSCFQELGAESLLNEWQEQMLIKTGENSEEYELTANGSWFINHMINEILQFQA